MALTYYLVQISPVYLFCILILIGGGFSGLTTYVFRKYIPIKILRSHNEVTGFVFMAIASFYGLLLSFIVFVFWNQLNETRGNASKEGSSAMGLYRDIKFYPDTAESKPLMADYLLFVCDVIDKEFPDMEHMQISELTQKSFSRVFFRMEHLHPKSEIQIQLVSEMFNHLNGLATYSGLHITAMENEIPDPMWLPILLGALVTIFCAMLLDIEHAGMHVLLNGMLGIFIGMFIFIIILLDHPYTGTLRIKPNSYQQILNMEQHVKPTLTIQNPNGQLTHNRYFAWKMGGNN